MRVTSTTPTPQKRPHALRVGGMDSRLRGNDGVCLAVKYYQNNSCLGNKYAGYKRIFDLKTPPISASASKIDIRGMVNDAVEALNGAPEPTVSVLVNGQAVTTQANQAAQVSDRYFLIPEVPLQIGANTIRITATDHLGNARSQDIQVSRIAAGSDRLTLLGGNRQSAAVNTELAKPLSIIALNAAGEPIANLPVNFDIMRGTGAISTSQGTPVKTNGITAARNLIVNTDANGKAQVWLTVGKQTGPGANAVKASHVKFGEEVTFTASTQRGAVFKISADLGTNQIAETNAQPLELLSAVVRDAQDNLLPNIPVVLTIEAGDASFPDSTGAQATVHASGPLPNKAAQRIVLNTDKNGLIALRPLIGNLEGTVRIKAQALKAETGNVNTASDPTAGGSTPTAGGSNWIGNATFLIQAKEAKDGPASFKGYVYDDKSRPLANVKVSIGRTASVSTTDANGLFQLDNIPPGRIDLFVDGRTVNPITAGNPQTAGNLQANDAAKPQYPSLHFEAYAIKGRDNQIAHPIYLPPLSTSPESVKTVGGAEDVILTIPGLAGFQMKVKANSVTFPDGSRVGTLVVSPVTADKLPMAPPAGGAQFGVPAWTVQPAGTRFDPPIEVTLPNASSQPAGDNLPIVQWDHDLGQYVAMGRATVSEDGSVLITDSGSGITKAGWGGLCRYDPDKCGKNAPPPPECNDCQRLESGTGDCPTGNCVDYPNLQYRNSGKCCGGKIIDTDKNCCVKIADQGNYITVEKDKPVIDVMPGANAEIFPNRSQYKGPPKSELDKPFNFQTFPNGVTHAIDGCSTPQDKFYLFPPNLFVNPNAGGNMSLNPLSKPFYDACSAHDVCYQTCKSNQNQCDAALRDNIFAYCDTLSNNDIGSGFYVLGGRTVSKRTECQLAATEMYLALAAVGFKAHQQRQKEMCIACPK
jgi:large repetitive protein